MNFEIVLLDAIEDYDRPYIYESQEDLIKGQLVFVPFGHGDKPREGLVLGPAEAFSGAKKVISASQIFINQDQVDAAIYLSDYYGLSLAAYLRLFLPRTLRVEPRKELVARKDLSVQDYDDYISLLDKPEELINKGLAFYDYSYHSRVKLPTRELIKPLFSREVLEDYLLDLPQNYARQIELLERLIYVYPSMLERSDESLAAIKSLEDGGLIERVYLPRRLASNYRQARPEEKALPELDEQKKSIYNDFLSDQSFMGLLIRENTQALDLYIHLAKKALEEERRLILVYPDASMVPGLVETFKKHFGDRVGVYHGRMSAREMKSELLYYMEGRFPIMITSRLGLFLPLKKGDYLVVEEAQDQGHQSQNPYYDGLELAAYYGRHMNIRVLFASSVPGLDLYMREDLVHFRLKEKLEVKTELVDMRRELAQANKSPLSERLVEELRLLLKSGGLALLLMNKRHYASYVFCRSCGYVFSCPQCGSSLYYNQKSSSFFCPSCNYSSKAPSQCPQCSSRAFRYYGGGIEMIYDELKKIFPQARIISVDAKTMSSKDGYINLHSQLRNKEVDIVLGTSLIARGLDYDIDFLAVVNADFYLHIPIYKAAERGYQMIRRFLERGRPGAKCLIQTYEPKNYVLESVLEDDSIGFLEKEMRLREARALPPFIDYLLIRVFGEGAKLDEDASRIAKAISHHDLEISDVFGQWLFSERRILVKGYDFEEIKKDLIGLRGQGLRFVFEVDSQNYV